jgi:FMN phosphatase YigB (HAD superfamily)
LFRTLVFDFGNVVGFFSHRLASERLAEYSDLSADEIHKQLWDSRLEDEYEANRITTAEFLRRTREACRLRCPDAVLLPIYTDIFYAPNQPVVDLLTRLKPRYRLVLASNTNELHAKQFLRQFAEALQPFDAVVLSHEVGARKPTGPFFAACQRVAQAAPGECLFIDDLAANVAGAEKAGWHGILYMGYADLCEKLAALGVLSTKDI